MLEEKLQEVDDWEPDYKLESLLDFQKSKYTNKEVEDAIIVNECFEDSEKNDIIKLMNNKMKESRNLYQKDNPLNEDESDSSDIDEIKDKMNKDGEGNEFLYDPIKDLNDEEWIQKTTKRNGKDTVINCGYCFVQIAFDFDLIAFNKGQQTYATEKVMNTRINSTQVKSGVSKDYWKHKKSELKQNELIETEPELSFPVECSSCETVIGSYLYSKKKYILDCVIEANG